MTRLRRIVSIASVGITTAVSAFAATPLAAAGPPPRDGPFNAQNWARTPENAAGVVFHPHADDFEIWDTCPTASPSRSGTRTSSVRNGRRSSRASTSARTAATCRSTRTTSRS